MIEEPASLQKTTDKNDKHYKCDKPYFRKGALTTHIKKDHNISNTITKKEFKTIYTNSESDNNNKNIKVDKIEAEHAKEQE